MERKLSVLILRDSNWSYFESKKSHFKMGFFVGNNILFYFLNLCVIY